MTYQHSIFSK